MNTYDFGSNWLASDGAALTPDGTELFAVTLAGGPTGAPTLNIIPNPEQPAPHPTSTDVTCSPSTAVIGQATSCTATVTDAATSGSTTPTGTVTFTSDTAADLVRRSSSPSRRRVPAGRPMLGQLHAGTSGPGTHTITASYGGDGSHVASSGQVTVSVTLRATATALSCSKVLPVRYKCAVTVSDTSPGRLRRRPVWSALPALAAASSARPCAPVRQRNRRLAACTTPSPRVPPLVVRPSPPATAGQCPSEQSRSTTLP